MSRVIDYVLQDSVLVSYPKSGRTWLRMIMAKLLDIKGFDIFKKEFMPAAHHEPRKSLVVFGEDKKVIFLHRDIGDVLSSYYAEKSTSDRSGRWYNGTTSEFIRNKNLGVDNAINFNKKWFHQASKNDKVKIVSYEELQENTCLAVRGIVDFLGFECSDMEIEEAVLYSRFENMVEIEKGKGINLLSNYKGNFGKGKGRVRRGKVGGYKEDFSEKDIEFINERKRILNYDY